MARLTKAVQESTKAKDDDASSFVQQQQQQPRLAAAKQHACKLEKQDKALKSDNADKDKFIERLHTENVKLQRNAVAAQKLATETRNRLEQEITTSNATCQEAQ